MISLGTISQQADASIPGNDVVVGFNLTRTAQADDGASNWNNIRFVDDLPTPGSDVTNLIDFDGNPFTGASFNFTTGTRRSLVGQGGAFPVPEMYIVDTYNYTEGAELSFVIKGLNDAKLYSLRIVGLVDAIVNYNLDCNGQVELNNGSYPSTSSLEDNAYVKFDNVSPENGEINVVCSPISDYASLLGFILIEKG